MTKLDLGMCTSLPLVLVHTLNTTSMSNMECELAVDSCIRGHHIFKNIWTPTMGEQLSCKREIGKNKDRYAVAVF